MKQALRFAMIFISLFILSSFNASFSPNLQDDLVPADFGKEPTTILIIESAREKLNEAFQEVFEKYYTGAIEIIPSTNMQSSKYDDKQKFRYFLKTDITFQAASGSGATRMPATYNYSYILIDRIADKKYGDGYGTDSWKNWLKRYVKKLEAAKQKNQGK